MTWYLLAYVMPLLLAVVSSLVLGAIVWQYREYAHAQTLFVLLVAVAWWAMTYVVAFGATGVQAKQLIYSLMFPAVGVVSIAWFLFAVQYTGRLRALRTREVGLLLLVPAITTIAALTNQHHSLVWTAVAVSSDGPLSVMTVEHGPLFWVFSAVSYLLLAGGTIAILETALLSDGIHRSQTVSLFLAAALPAVLNVLYLSGATGPLDLTPSGFSLSGAILIGAVFRDQLLQSMPLARELARDRILDEMASAVIILDSDDQVVDLNPAAETLSDAARADVVGSHIRTVLPGVADPYRNIVGTASDTHVHITRAEDGSTRHYQLECAPVDRGYGTGPWQLLTLRDVTEQRNRERQLMHERDRISAVFDAAPYPLTHVDWTDGEPTVLRVNDAFESVFGYDEAEVVGESIDKYIVPDSAEDSAADINEQARRGMTIEQEVTRSTATGDRREFLFSSASLTGESGAESIGAYVDLTERNRRVEMLEQIRRNITDVIWMSDTAEGSTTKGQIEFVSESYEDVWGRSTDSLYDDPSSFVDGIHPDDRERVRAALADQSENPDEYNERYRVVTPDGDVRWVQDRSVGVYEDGTLKRIMGVATDITERHRRSTELKQERQFIEQALNTLTDIFYVLDTDGTIRRWNDRLSVVTGLDGTELEGRHATTLFPDAEQNRVSQVIDSTLTEGGAVVESNLITSGGDTVPYEFTGARLTDGDGETTGIVGIGRDISDRKQREQRLRRYKTILEVIGDPVYAIDETGRYTYVNEAFVDRTGYEREFIIGSHVSKVLSDAEIERGREIIRELLSSDKQSLTWEMVRRGSNGETIPTENNTALLPFDEDGKFRGSVGVVRDISERKQRTRQLRTFQEAVENAGRMIYWMDGDGTVEYANPAFERVTGHEAVELVGETRAPLLSNAETDGMAEEMLDALTAGDTWEAEFTTAMPARGRRVIKQTITPIHGGDGPARLVGVAADITTEQNREQQLSVLQRVLRHDLRNNLNEILLSTQLAHQSAESDDVQQYLDGATQTVDEILSLIEDVQRLRETFQQEGASDRVVDIAAVTQAQVESLRTQRPEARFATELPDSAEVMANGLIERAIRNVLMNAIQHNNTETPEVDVSLERQDEEIELRIADNGPGIPEEVIEVLQSDRETQLEHLDGFGLWLVSWVVGLSGGVVKFSENDPRGSVVRVLLPAARSPTDVGEH